LKHFTKLISLCANINNKKSRQILKFNSQLKMLFDIWAGCNSSEKVIQKPTLFKKKMRSYFPLYFLQSRLKSRNFKEVPYSLICILKFCKLYFQGYLDGFTHSGLKIGWRVQSLFIFIYFKCWYHVNSSNDLLYNKRFTFDGLPNVVSPTMSVCLIIDLPTAISPNVCLPYHLLLS